MLIVQPVRVRRWKMTMNHLEITDLGDWGDPAQASSVVKVLTGAGRANDQAVASSECCSFDNATPLDPDWWGNCGCRAHGYGAKAEPAAKASSNAVVGATGVRATAWSEGLAE